MKHRGIVMVVAVGLALSGAYASAQSHSDKEFLEKSSQGNVAEVELAKLALAKSQNPQVRAFAQKMIHDHEMLARKMAPFLAQAGVEASGSLNSDHQDIYNKLKGLSGADFDKEYVQDMDKDHHHDLKEFRDEINSTKDPQLKDAVISGEKVIAEHTHIIDGITQKMGMTPAST